MDIFNCPENNSLIDLNDNKILMDDLDFDLSTNIFPEKDVPAFGNEKEISSLTNEEDNDKNENNLFFNPKEEKPTINFKVIKGVDNACTKVSKKKRGRKIKEKKSKYKREHKFDSQDNILRKIQTHFLNFIIYFLNIILKDQDFKLEFMKLNYKFKRQIKASFIHSLKSKSIKEIITNEISRKYKTLNKNYNSQICEVIKNNIIINNILSENYLSFFKNVYFKSNNIIDLKEYGSDKIILLENDKRMFKGLLIKNKDKKKIYRCVKLYYLPDLLFFG